MKQLQNKRGTTLVELIVCMVLLSILTLAAVTLIRPSAQAYRDIQLQTRAQNLADALIETIRGEVLDANGYIRFTNGATQIWTACLTPRPVTATARRWNSASTRTMWS